jgi:hypothetical protein
MNHRSYPFRNFPKLREFVISMRRLDFQKFIGNLSLKYKFKLVVFLVFKSLIIVPSKLISSNLISKNSQSAN